jgi:hypothetical protein
LTFADTDRAVRHGSRCEPEGEFAENDYTIGKSSRHRRLERRYILSGHRSKGAIDSYLRRKEEARKFVLDKRVQFLEQQLSQFYWPIYLHLQKENLYWERLRERTQDPESSQSKLSIQIESGVILPSHKEAMAVIEANLHLAGNSSVVEESLRYVRHVKLYQMLRAAGIKDDPVNHGEPYPAKFFPLIHERVNALQFEYDSLIRQTLTPEHQKSSAQ